MRTRPVTQTLRLAELDPRAVADEVVSMVRAHMGRLAITLMPGVKWTEIGGLGDDVAELCARPAETNLSLIVVRLTRFAQTGELGDWLGAWMAGYAISDVFAALYTSAGGPKLGCGVLDVAGADPDVAIGIVLVAAKARVSLARRRVDGISARELGVLAGLSATQVRLLARRGELTLEDGVCPRGEAKLWLSGRGVLGL